MQGYMRERKPKVWGLEVYIGRDPLTGKKKYRTKTFHGGKRAASTELAKFITQVSVERAPDTEGTVAYLMETWMRLVERDRSPTTHQNYRYIVDRDIVPNIGHIKLKDLTSRHLDAMYEKIGKRTVAATGELISANTILQTHAVIRKALNMAVKWGWIDRSPVAQASPPSRVQKAKRHTAIGSYLKMLAGAHARDEKLGVLVRLAAASGCRRGELCGFQWPDINWDKGAITVNRAIAVVKNPSTPGKRKLIVKGPKTHQIRTISLDPDMMQVLAGYRRRCEEQALLDADGLIEDAYLFSHEPDGSRPWQPQWVTDNFGVVRDLAGMEKIVLHGLRHLSASLQVSAGIPLPVVQARLGHESQQTTFGYTHALPGADAQAAAVLGALLNPTTS